MNSLDKIITALAPVFAAGFAVQQLLEILTSFLDLDSKEAFQKYKKPILGGLAFLLGLALAAQLKLGVLNILTGATPNADVSPIDFLATALIISAGTEGINSILKFLKYSKEEKKREAAASDPKSAVGGTNGGAGAGVPKAVLPTPGANVAAEPALARISRQ